MKIIARIKGDDQHNAFRKGLVALRMNGTAKIDTVVMSPKKDYDLVEIGLITGKLPAAVLRGIREALFPGYRVTEIAIQDGWDLTIEARPTGAGRLA